MHYGDIHTLWNTYLDFQNDSVPRIDASKVGNATELCDGDLLLADASEDLDGVGKAVEVINISGLAFSGLHTIACRPRSERIAPGFSGLCCEFPSVKTHFRRVANGLKVFGLSKASLRDTPLPLPGPDEQRAIAAALSDVDDLLQSLDRLIAKKRDVKQGAMQQLLTGTTRLPGFEEAWETKQLGELGKFFKGSGIKKDEVRSEGLPCVRYGEIYTSFENWVAKPRSFITEKTATQATQIQVGDLLFAASGETAEEIGKCVAYLAEGPAFAGGDIVALRPADDCDSLYLGCLLNTPEIARQKSRLGQGHPVAHIGARALGQVVISLPPLPEQRAIAAVLSDMDAEINALEARREKVAAIKQGMMQELLTGRTRLPIPQEGT